MMFELISISAEIGSIEHDGYIQKKIDSLMKKINLRRIYRRIDKVLDVFMVQDKYVEEFIKCVGSVYASSSGDKICFNGIEISGFNVDFEFTYFNNSRAKATMRWNDEYDSIDSFDIDFSNNFTPVTVTHISKTTKPIYTAKDANTYYLNKQALATCMAHEMKYICKSLIYKEELKHVH